MKRYLMQIQVASFVEVTACCADEAKQMARDEFNVRTADSVVILILDESPAAKGL